MAEGASAFADTTELAARWRALSPDETVKAALYLDDATRDIRRAYPDVQTRMAADTDLVLEVQRITCNVVRRRMTGEDFESVEQISETQGPFGRSRTFRAPVDSGLELTANERRILSGSTGSGAGLAQWTNEP